MMSNVFPNTCEAESNGSLENENAADEASVSDTSYGSISNSDTVIVDYLSHTEEVVSTDLEKMDVDGLRKARRAPKTSSMEFNEDLHEMQIIFDNTRLKKLWRCKVCCKVFRYRYMLMLHSVTHLNRQYKCKTCPRAFRQPNTLLQHDVTHNKETSLKCEICSATFNNSSTLLIHKRIHNKSKPFQCKECGKSFHQSGNLKVHMYIHKGLKPYRCDICFKQFSQSSNCAQHEKQIHGVVTFACSSCYCDFSTRSELNYHAKTEHLEREEHTSVLCMPINIHVSAFQNGDILFAVVTNQENKRIIYKLDLFHDTIRLSPATNVDLAKYGIYSCESNNEVGTEFVTLDDIVEGSITIPIVAYVVFIKKVFYKIILTEQWNSCEKVNMMETGTLNENEHSVGIPMRHIVGGLNNRE